MSDITQAFAHPELRAAATASDPMLDRLSLRDFEVSVDIGAFQAERGVRQRIVFNIVVELAPIDGPIEDDVDRILSYDRLTDAIEIELAAERLNLLETLAERVADRILAEPRAHRVFVRIEKTDRGPGALGVEIVRAADQSSESAALMDAPAPHPIVVHLTPDAMAHPKLKSWLNFFNDSDEVVVFTVAEPEMRAVDVTAPLAQRRIDLLAIEQQAWRLAAFDARCVVRATRTEIDWAMKQGQMTVWAPSKMVLDAVDGPEGDGEAAAKWLAETLEAKNFLRLGDGASDLQLDGPLSISADT